MMSPTAVFVTTDLFFPFPGLKWLPGALVQTGCTGFELFPSVNLTRLVHSSMRTIMRSTVLIFYENTTLLCCISLTLASLNSELPNSILLCWILMSLSRSLSLGKISLTLFFFQWLASAVLPAVQLGAKKKTRLKSTSFFQTALCQYSEGCEKVKFTCAVLTTSKI